MAFRSDEEACVAIRAFLATVGHGRLSNLWTAEGPTEQAVEYVEKGSPLSHGEAVLLRVAFDFWNGAGKATLDDLLNVLDDKNLRAVLDLVALYRPGVGGRA